MTQGRGGFDLVCQFRSPLRAHSAALSGFALASSGPRACTVRGICRVIKELDLADSEQYKLIRCV